MGEEGPWAASHVCDECYRLAHIAFHRHSVTAFNPLIARSRRSDDPLVQTRDGQRDHFNRSI